MPDVDLLRGDGAANRSRALSVWYRAALDIGGVVAREVGRLDRDVATCEARGLHRLAADLRAVRYRLAALTRPTEAALAAWRRLVAPDPERSTEPLNTGDATHV